MSSVDDVTFDNADVGLNAETAACERWPLERVSGDADEPDWYDAVFAEDLTADLAGIIVPADTKTEVKTCRNEYRNRKGRWWIRRKNHERLLQEDGEYVLSVHDPDTGAILRQGLFSATCIDEEIDEWWPCGDGGQQAEEFVQLPWSRVFDGIGGAWP